MDSSPQLQHILEAMADQDAMALPTPVACLAGKESQLTLSLCSSRP